MKRKKKKNINIDLDRVVVDLIGEMQHELENTNDSFEDPTELIDQSETIFLKIDLEIQKKKISKMKLRNLACLKI